MSLLAHPGAHFLPVLSVPPAFQIGAKHELELIESLGRLLRSDWANLAGLDKLAHDKCL